MDTHLNLTTPDQLKLLAKPMVTTLITTLRVLFPDTDLTYADDEWVRPLPGKYELQVHYRFLNTGVEVTYLEIVIPGRIEHQAVDVYGSPLDFPWGPALLVELHKLWPVFPAATLNSHVLRLRW
jgi:hypothetical protein